MDAMFLQETEASIVMFDLRGFSTLAAQSTPVDLGIVLAHYYAHVEESVRANDGRIIRFAGDNVLAAWLENEVPNHQQKSLAALARAQHERKTWLEKNRDLGLPVLDYCATASSGPILAGQIGTARLKSFDVLGETVNIAAKLTTVATARKEPNLATFRLPEFPAVEVEGVELGGKLIRLYRLE